jgi:hypothetical protein
MKVKTFLCWCMAPLCVTAQKITVTAGVVVTINKVQTLPTLGNNGRVVLTENAALTLTGTASGTGIMSVNPKSSLTVQSANGGTVYFDPSQNTLRNLSVYGGCTLGNKLNITAGQYPGTVKLMGHLFSD